MPIGLKRYQNEADDHFITFSCHDRKPHLNTPTAQPPATYSKKPSNPPAKNTTSNSSPHRFKIMNRLSDTLSKRPCSIRNIPHGPLH